MIHLLCDQLKNVLFIAALHVEVQNHQGPARNSRRARRICYGFTQNVPHVPSQSSNAVENNSVVHTL